GIQKIGNEPLKKGRSATDTPSVSPSAGGLQVGSFPSRSCRRYPRGANDAPKLARVGSSCIHIYRNPAGTGSTMGQAMNAMRDDAVEVAYLRKMIQRTGRFKTGRVHAIYPKERSAN